MAAAISTAIKNALLTVLLKNTNYNGSFLYNTGGYGLIFYTGAPPANPDLAATGTALNTITPLGATPWIAPSNGVVALAAPISITPTQTLTAGYARLTGYGGTVFDMDVGVAGSGAALIVSTTSFTNGVPVSVTNMSVQIPASLGTVLLNTALRNAIMASMIPNTTATAITLATGGVLSAYSGAAPATADLPATGTLLATWNTSSTTWGTVAAGSVPLTGTPAVNATATGTIGYIRFTNGTYVMQMSIGTSGADVTVDNVSTTAGNPVTITNATANI